MTQNKLLAASLALSALWLASGCGMTSMPDKIDQSNATQNKLLDGIGASNTTQGKLLSGIGASNDTQAKLLAGISTSNATQGNLLDGIATSNQTQLLIKAAVEMTNGKISATNGAIHLQTLAQAESGLFSPAASTYLDPVPLDMIPFGQTFANEMHEDEFTQQIGAWLQFINVAALDPTKLPPGKTPADVEHDKQVRLWAVRIISGTAPQELIQQMVDVEITQGGANSDVVPMILAARWDFIYNVLLHASLLQASLDNPGKIKLAAMLESALDYIDALPFASQIELPTGGMQNNVDLTIDPAKVAADWKRVASAFKTELGPTFKPLLTTGTGPAADSLKALQAVVQARVTPLQPPAKPPTK